MNDKEQMSMGYSRSLKTYRATDGGSHGCRDISRIVGAYDDYTQLAADMAQRIARKLFGPRAYVRTLNQDSTATDGSSATYQAFVGKNGPERGTTVGRNVWVYLHREDE